MPGAGIHGTELILLTLVTSVALLAALAQKLKTPYPIVLVLGGLVLSFVPAVPNVSLNPTFIFLVVLPPLLFASALNTSWREFRHNIVMIGLLAFALVGFTVAGVAVAAHLLMPGFDLKTGAVLGAVVCTTDAIAAGAIARRVGLPRRLVDIIEGESLINDASGLLALQFAAAIVASGTAPSLLHGFWQLLYLVGGGIAAGMLVGKIISLFERPLQGSALQTLVSVATPYFAYLLGEGIHASGVLATVACGLYIGRKASDTFTSEARLDSRAVWNTIDFALNGFVFILIGLQLPAVLDGMRPLNWPRLIGGAAFVCALVIALRIVWMFPGARLAHFIQRRLLHQQIARPNPRELFVIGWSGMRGVLALAAALSLPVVTDTGNPFPHRQAIIFLAFSVILVTLVGQGLSLPVIIRKLRVCESTHDQLEERVARRALLSAALESLVKMRDSNETTDEVSLDLLERYYRQRLKDLGPDDDHHSSAQRDRIYANLSGRLRQVERNELVKLRDNGEIGDGTLRKLERELDLLDMRWRVSS